MSKTNTPDSGQPLPSKSGEAENTLSYEDLFEAYSALQLENSRLVAEVARLRVDVTDPSHSKLTTAQPVSTEPPGAPLQSAPAAESLDNTATLDLLKKIKANPDIVVTTVIETAAAGHREEAAFLAERSVHATQGQPDMHMRWVRQLRYRKEFDLAIALCNACFPADGDHPLLRLNRGYLLYEAGQHAQAAEDLEIAGASRSHSIEEKLVAASARKRLGQKPKANQNELIASFFRPAEATFAAESFDSETVKRSLARYGCAWIKGLFNPDDLVGFDRIIASNIDGILNVYRELGLPDSFLFVGFPLYFASEPNREKIQQCFKNSYPSLFDPGKMAGVDNRPLPEFVFSNLRRTGLNKVIREYLRMERLYVSAAACHIRYMYPQGVRSYGEFHQDNRLYNSDAEILTLWFPFRYQHGPMPSLEFLPIRSDSHFPCVSVCGIDNEMFEPELFWRPAYELGDAMLLSGFSPHRTYFEPDMTLDRTSIDFRIFASPLPEPIFEDRSS